MFLSSTEASAKLAIFFCSFAHSGDLLWSTYISTTCASWRPCSGERIVQTYPALQSPKDSPAAQLKTLLRKAAARAGACDHRPCQIPEDLHVAYPDRRRVRSREDLPMRRFSERASWLSGIVGLHGDASGTILDRLFQWIRLSSGFHLFLKLHLDKKLADQCPS